MQRQFVPIVPTRSRRWGGAQDPAVSWYLDCKQLHRSLGTGQSFVCQPASFQETFTENRYRVLGLALRVSSSRHCPVLEHGTRSFKHSTGGLQRRNRQRQVYANIQMKIFVVVPVVPSPSSSLGLSVIDSLIPGPLMPGSTNYASSSVDERVTDKSA